MNRKQKTVLWLGITVVLLMALFPPWLRIDIGGGVWKQEPLGRQFFFSPPERQIGHEVFVDIGRLHIEWMIASAITLAVFIVFTKRSI